MNPAATLEPWCFFVVDLWMRCRLAAGGGPLGMRGPSVLPGPGGWQDQPSALMDAFDYLDSVMREEGADG